MKDFTAGLWTRGESFLMPATAAQEFTDAYPMPQGGIRSFFAPTSRATTGVVTPSDERCSGVFYRGGIPNRTGGGFGADLYMTTLDSSNVKRLYRWDETNGDVQWSLIKTFAAGGSSALHKDSFRFFQDSGGTDYVLLALRGDSADDGIWSIEYSAGTVTQRKSQPNENVALAIHQARILTSNGRDELQWSDAGAFTFPAGNTLEVEPNQIGSRIEALIPTTPDDLLVAKTFAPWVSIQGSLSDPVVYQLSGSHFVGTGRADLPEVEGPIAFIEPEGDLYLTDGRQFDLLSAQLEKFPDPAAASIVSSGDLVYLNHFLFAPDGLTYDQRTGGWFQLSDVAGSGSFMSSDKEDLSRTVLVATAGTSFSLFEYRPYDDATRSNSWTWKSAPLQTGAGRQLEIREVQVALSCFGTSTVTVTVNGTTRTVNNISSGRQVVPFLFQERGEYLDVQIDASKNTSGEAPILEALRIGTGRGHLVR